MWCMGDGEGEEWLCIGKTKKMGQGWDFAERQRMCSKFKN